MINHIKVSRNFHLYEFQCKGKNCCGGVVKLDPKVLSCIQKVRSYVQKPVIITSGFRCPKHNKKEGGRKGSYHTQGMAVDYWVTGYSVKMLAELADYCGFTGIGTYKGKYFIHADTGKKRRFQK